MTYNVNRWRDEIIWAAGLFEGEGSIVWTSVPNKNKGKGSRYTRMQLSLHSTDKDVVVRFANAVGVGSVQGPYRYPTKDVPNRKPSWYWAVASHEPAQAALAMFWPWLGLRRRAKAKEVLLLERAARPKKNLRNQKGRFTVWKEKQL